MELDLLTQVLRAVYYTFVLISALLLVGAYFRARFKVFQKLFLPASVIGGFIGLILGPIVLKKYAVLPIPDDWITIASLLPGLLIVPVVASVPLGMSFRSNGENVEGTSSNQTLMPVLIMFFMLAFISASQNLFSLLTSFSFKNFFNYEGIYPTFGTELSAGFAGGHGTAGVVGNLLQSTFDQPYWNTAQGVTTTTATVGLISGILIGIVLINIRSEEHTSELQSRGHLVCRLLLEKKKKSTRSNLN